MVGLYDCSDDANAEMAGHVLLLLFYMIFWQFTAHPKSCF